MNKEYFTFFLFYRIIHRTQRLNWNRVGEQAEIENGTGKVSRLK
jgi:hypothetical protein